MISLERLEKSLTFIAETDEKAAELKTNVERAAYKLKRTKAILYIHEDGAVELRKAKAEQATETIEAEAEFLHAHQLSEALQNKRKTEFLIVDVWRSLNASKRHGNIV